MKNIVVFFGFICLNVVQLCGQNISFNFNTSPYISPSSTNTNFLISDLTISIGTISTNISTGSYFANEPYIEGNTGWNQTSQSTAKQFCFTMTPNSNVLSYTLTSFSLDAYATGAGPSAGGFSITNNSTTNYYAATNLPDAGSSVTNIGSSALGLNGISGPSTICVQGWLNGSRTSTGGGAYRLDNFDLGIASVFLPIDLKSFKLVKIHKSTNLIWTTSYENSSSHFLIQRSFDGVSFETIGQIKSVGNSNITNNYSFLDEQPKKGNNYYRLVQVDLDGTKNTYKMEMMHMPYEKGFELLNTVLDQSNSELQIRSDVEKYNLSVYSITGHKVMELQNVAYDQTLDTKTLAKGTYIIHLEGNGAINSLKFIKN